MIMKVWMFKSEFTLDGDNECIVRLFNNLDSALKAFEASRIEFYNGDHLAQDENCVIEDDNAMFFCAYLDGAYSEDHLTLSVEEIPVED